MVWVMMVGLVQEAVIKTVWMVFTLAINGINGRVGNWKKPKDT
jgi:hypothetical protein